MPSPTQDREGSAVTNLLKRYQAGDAAAFSELIPLVYQELREIAHRHRTRWTGGETLGTTALVNEAYLKMAGERGASYADRSHFLAVASRAMRQILIDSVRARRATKRGGAAEHVPLDRVAGILQAFPGISEDDENTILLLNESLKRLESESERYTRIVECRYFGGMTIEETAQALGLSPATVKRGWNVAQAWLRRDIECTRVAE
jgi:RNA polymerase sigma factor (TIGR02999 family)